MLEYFQVYLVACCSKKIALRASAGGPPRGGPPAQVAGAPAEAALRGDDGDLQGHAKPRNARHLDTSEGGGNMVGDRVQDTSSSMMIAAYIF